MTFFIYTYSSLWIVNPNFNVAIFNYVTQRSTALLCCGKVSQKFRFKNKINKYKLNIE